MTAKQEALYWRKWSLICDRYGWPQSDNQRRHDLHIQALGQNKSHRNFTNPEFDRILAVMNKLADPDSVAAQMVLDEYENKEDPGERRRLIYRINQLADEPYTLALCRNMFQTSRWQDLPLDSLTILRDTLVTRFRARKKREQMDVVTRPSREDCPF